MISKKTKEIIYFIILFFFSISFNQYYGHLGINPIDSFFSFNSGYDILNGHFPFKDYWTITGPFIAFTQAFFFKVLGVSWFSYVLQASIFNCIITIFTFYTLYKFKLNINFCFIYSFLVAILAYPSSGTPYVDHHSSYTSIISIFCFILALRTNQKIYWFLLPILLGISFLTKQTPTGYIFLIIIFSSIIYFIFNFNIKKIALGLFGSAIIISLFLITLALCKISLTSFVQQYILFPMSLGESRLQFLLPLEFSRIFLRFKLIHLSSMLLLIVCIKEIIKEYKYLRSNEFLILISLIASSYALIIHQLMTINGIFIFFIIPIFAGFSHIYFLKYYKNKNYILFFLIFLSISSTIYYGYKYIHNRDFMDLRKANIKNSVNAKILDGKLSGLKWITPLYPDDPNKEISQLSAAIQIIKEDSRVKTIITDYQFISVILSTYDYSPSQVWYGYHVNPIRGDKYYEIYQRFFLNKLKENKVEVVYLVKPLWENNAIFEESINHKCFEKNNLTEILDIYILLKCKELMS